MTFQNIQFSKLISKICLFHYKKKNKFLALYIAFYKCESQIKLL